MLRMWYGRRRRIRGVSELRQAHRGRMPALQPRAAAGLEFLSVLRSQYIGTEACAEAAARTVLAGKASGAPKLADGPIEAVRMLRVARTGAVKARTATLNTLRSVVITAPEPLRTQLRSLSSAQLVVACTRLRPDVTKLADRGQVDDLSSAGRLTYPDLANAAAD